MTHPSGLWVSVHFCRLALDLHLNAESISEPLVILSAPPSPSVLLANDQAEQQGISPGMSFHAACCLSEHLLHRTYNEKEVSGHLEQLAQWACQYSAAVTLYPPDTLLLEIKSMITLFGGAHALLGQIRAALQAQGYSVSLATGHTPLSARILAHAQIPCEETLESRIRAHLNRVPVRQALLPDDCSSQLERMGLSTLGHVLNIPEFELGKRFGRGLCDHLARITGTLPDPQERYSPPEQFDDQITLLHEVTQSSGLVFPIRRQLQRLENYLQLRVQSTSCLLFTFTHRHEASTHLEIRFTEPQRHAGDFLPIVHLKLESAPLAATVTQIRLQVREFSDPSPDTSDLFFQYDHGPYHPVKASSGLINRLMVRLGQQALSHPALRNSHVPEQQGQMTPPIPLRVRTSGVSGHHGTDHLPFVSRPVWLCPTPCPLPSPIIALLDGPERICSDWWNSPGIVRDYYIARFSHGAIGWVFRDRDKKWYVHGWFG